MTQRISARLESADAERLQALAKRLDLSQTEVLREAVRRFDVDGDGGAERPTQIAVPTDDPAAPRAAESESDDADPSGRDVPPEPAHPPTAPPARARPASFDHGVGVRVLTVAFDSATARFDDESLQRFLLNKRIKRLLPAFFQSEAGAFWTAWVEYESLGDQDRRQGPVEADLSRSEQALMERLRGWRKVTAEAAGVPVFVIATNAELLAVVRERPRTLEALGQIRGFGRRKLERHGREILALVEGFDTPAAG